MAILVVEDEGLVASNLANGLRRSGYEVSGIASSGEEALEKVSTLKPDLVLMDIHLRGKLDGIETAERVRSEFSIPVIFLTAHANPEVLERAKQTHPFGYLVKPIRQVDLVSNIEVALYKHQMERRLRQREAWLVTTLRCVGDGVIVTDADGRIEFFNDLSKRILGIHDRDVIGANFCDVVHLKNRFTGAPCGDLVQLAILQGATMSIGSDLILVDAHHQEADFEGELALCEIDGLIVGTVFTFRDVSVRNYQEERGRQDFGTRVCARLAGAVSTELRSLLQAPIDGKERLLDGDEENRAPHLASISRIVDKLDVVRRSNGSFPCALNLNELISDTCSALHTDLPANIELTAQCQPDLALVYADPAHIKQAIISLVLHSQDSMPTGGTIRFITESCAFERRDRTGSVQSYVRLTVNNTNSGMDARKADRLFEPFSGADPAADKLDLRLFIAHEIISSAGGSIRAKATHDEGVCFEVLLPQLVNQDAPACSVAAAIIVLYADHAVRRLILDGLTREGHDAVGASDFVEASEWTTIYPDSISVMITDMGVSPLSGPEAADWNSVRYPGTRVVFTPDHAVDPEIRRYWMDQGARLLEKPFRLDELLKIVNEMMLPARG